jgi:hypothetical protein
MDRQVAPALTASNHKRLQATPSLNEKKSIACFKSIAPATSCRNNPQFSDLRLGNQNRLRLLRWSRAILRCFRPRCLSVLRMCATVLSRPVVDIEVE